MFLKVEQFGLVGESSKMCLIRGSEKAVLQAPERWACVCRARAREHARAASARRPLHTELHPMSGCRPRTRAWPPFWSAVFPVACKGQLKYPVYGLTGANTSTMRDCLFVHFSGLQEPKCVSAK